MNRAKKRKYYNELLNSMPTNMSLQHWLNRVSEFDLGISDALEGIYCGREGRVHEHIGDGLWIDFGWYTVSDIPRIEYAYVS